MFRGVFADPPHMGLDNIVPIQKRHFSVRLHPDLVLGMLGDMVERSNMELKLPGFGELPKTRPEGEEVIASNRGRKLRNGLADVVDTVALDTEAVRIVGAVNQMGNITANVVCQFLEQALGLDVGEGTHLFVLMVGLGVRVSIDIDLGLGFFFSFPLCMRLCEIGRVTVCALPPKFFRFWFFIYVYDYLVLY